MDKYLLMTPENAVKCNRNEKTMTRRLQGLEYVNLNPDAWGLDHIEPDGRFCLIAKDNTDYVFVKSRFQIGDRVGIREAHYLYGCWHLTGGFTKTQKQEWMLVLDEGKPVYYIDTFPENTPKAISNFYFKGAGISGWYLRPSMFMFKEHIRTWRTVTSVKCERLTEITNEDAVLEGCGGEGWADENPNTARTRFAVLWNSINPKMSWSLNPWVFAYSWDKRIKQDG